jgi:hypothetical protein
MRLEDYQNYYSILLPIYYKIKIPLTRGEGWEALKELADDFHYNPLVWFISKAVKSNNELESKKEQKSKKELTFDLIIVFGPPGSGKTSYVIQSMLYVFEDVNEVRKRIVFDTNDFKQLLENVENGQRYDVVLFDDPSAIGLTSMWYMRRGEEKLKNLELFDAFVFVKDFISLAIFTVPRLVSLPKYFRDIATWFVQVKKEGKVIFMRKDAGRSKSGTVKEVDVPEMFFYIKNPRIPDEIWNEMMEKRRNTIRKKFRKYRELDKDDADV